MAMSKADQKAASDRIMGKFPLTPEERQTYEMLVKTPDQYVPPNPESGVRVCGICKAEFQGVAATREDRAKAVLEEFSDHMKSHNQSPAQWTEAHRRIQAGKDRAKAKEKESLSA